MRYTLCHKDLPVFSYRPSHKKVTLSPTPHHLPAREKSGEHSIPCALSASKCPMGRQNPTWHIKALSTAIMPSGVTVYVQANWQYYICMHSVHMYCTTHHMAHRHTQILIVRKHKLTSTYKLSTTLLQLSLKSFLQHESGASKPELCPLQSVSFQSW